MRSGTVRAVLETAQPRTRISHMPSPHLPAACAQATTDLMSSGFIPAPKASDHSAAILALA